MDTFTPAGDTALDASDVQSRDAYDGGAADAVTTDAVPDMSLPSDAGQEPPDALPPDGQEMDTGRPALIEFCNSGEDDDGDGAADCADEDCAQDVWCVDAPNWIYYAVCLPMGASESCSVRAVRTDDLASSVAVTPLEPLEGVYEYPLSVSPDGRTLVIELRSGGEVSTALLDLQTGSRAELLVRNGWTVRPIGWSGPRELVGVCTRFGPAENQYCRLRLDEFEVEVYAYDPDDDSFATLTLDGSGLYIIRVLEAPNPFRPGVFRAELVLLDLATGVRTLVSESPPWGLQRVPGLQAYLWGADEGLELRDAAFDWIRDVQIPNGATPINRTRVMTRGERLSVYSWTGSLIGEHDYRAFAGASGRYSRVAFVTPSPVSADAFVPFFLDAE